MIPIWRQIVMKYRFDSVAITVRALKESAWDDISRLSFPFASPMLIQPNTVVGKLAIVIYLVSKVKRIKMAQKSWRKILRPSVFILGQRVGRNWNTSGWVGFQYNFQIKLCHFGVTTGDKCLPTVLCASREQKVQHCESVSTLALHWSSGWLQSIFRPFWHSRSLVKGKNGTIEQNTDNKTIVN